MNGYYTEYRLHVGAKTRDLTSIPICDKTKKQIREGKFKGHQGWKGQLFFEVDIMNAVTLKHEHPIEYELLWTRSSNHWKFPRYHKNLGFPSKDLDGSSIVQEEVCRLFENEETPRKVRAYFQGFFPPGYGNQYSFDRIKEYIRCQSMLCGSPVTCVKTRQTKTGTQKLFRCTEMCPDGKSKCPFKFLLQCDFRGYYIDFTSQCCKWHLCT